MENNEFQNLWKDVDSGITPKSPEELNRLLDLKIKETMNKFLIMIGVSAFICFGLIIFLVIATLNRPKDLIYQLNNLVLGVITIFSFIYSIWSWKKLTTNRFNSPLKVLLEEKIKTISCWAMPLRRIASILTILIVFILVLLSIHVYFENKSFVEVFKSEESVVGLIVGSVVGLLVAFYGSAKMRKYQQKNLEDLKQLLRQLEDGK